MEESNHKNSEDLDAGWDTSDGLDAGWDKSAQRVSSASTKPVKPVAHAIVDEIDAGWDADAPVARLSSPAPELAPIPKIQLSLSRVEGPTPASNEISPALVAAAKKPAPVSAARPKDAAKKPAPIAVKATPTPVAALPVSIVAANQPAHKLTKKDRRDLERQQRALSAKKQAELKRQRKEQRRTAAAQNKSQPQTKAEAPAAANVKSQSATKAKTKRKSKPQRAVRPATDLQGQDARTMQRAAARTNEPFEADSSDRDSSTEMSSSTSAPRTNQRLINFVAVSIILAVLALLFFFQKK